MKALKRILLVEDSQDDADLTIGALENNNLADEVVHVHDGAEALDYLFRRGPFAGRDDQQPGVILLDLKMPKVSGLEVLRQVKEDPGLRIIPVVVMTSSREDSDVRSSYQLGGNAFVVKPIDFHDLDDAVKQVGAFWAMLNEPPPGSVPKTRPRE